MTYRIPAHQREALVSEVRHRSNLCDVYRVKGEIEEVHYQAGLIHGIMHTVGVLYGSDNRAYKEAEDFWLRFHAEPEDAEVPQRDCPHFDME